MESIQLNLKWSNFLKGLSLRCLNPVRMILDRYEQIKNCQIISILHPILAKAGDLIDKVKIERTIKILAPENRSNWHVPAWEDYRLYAC